MRRATATVLLLLAGLVAGCGGDDEALGDRPDLPTTPPDLWNPCDGLDPAAVSTTFATTFTARTGTPAEPLCSFAPTTEGDPAVEVNYQLYAGTLDDLLDSFGTQVEQGRTQVTSLDVADADEARIILDISHDTLAVTGFVRNGRLVQVVNTLDPAPFDRVRLRQGVAALLGDLAASAAGSGLGDGMEHPPTD